MNARTKIIYIYLVLGQVQYQLAHGQRVQQDNDENRPIATSDLRFNKFTFPEYALKPKGFKPLKKADYPITGYVNDTLRVSSAESVITPDDMEVVYNVPLIIDAIGGLPPQPEANITAEFWKVSIYL
jgi:hypothetical protein